MGVSKISNDVYKMTNVDGTTLYFNRLSTIEELDAVPREYIRDLKEELMDRIDNMGDGTRRDAFIECLEAVSRYTNCK